MLAAIVVLLGTWRGESLCTTGAPNCHNERVVYYIRGSDRPDEVMIQADKILNGKAVTMGVGPWHYDRSRGTLEWKTPGRVWLLKVDGKRIEGTLTVEDGVVFRRMKLEKD